MTEQVERTFSRYGPTVCHSIRLEAQKPGGLRRMMSRLNIREGLRNQNVVEALDKFIERHGVNAFLERLIEDLQRANSDLRRQQQDRPPRPSSRNLDDEALPTARAKSNPESSLEQPAATDDPAPATSVEPAVEKPVPVLAQNSSIFDANGNFIGAERRSGTERRSGLDRRTGMHPVESNQRYGRDRRQTIRRTADLHKSHRELGMP